MKTPIMSAKRPKKWNAIPTQSSSFENSSADTLRRSLIRSSGTNSNVKKELPHALTPMHHARPVPRDSHLVVPEPGPVFAAGTYEVNATVEADFGTDTNVGNDGESPASASWVGRKVDAIFSPVLSFLQAATSSSSVSDGDGRIGHTQIQPHAEKDSECSGNDETPSCEDQPEDLLVSRKNLFAACHENYDGIPAMTNTGSSGSNVDTDGDVPMADCNKSFHVDDVVSGPSQSYSSAPLEARDLAGGPTSASSTDILDVPENGCDEDEDEFNPYLFIKCLPPYQHATPPGWASQPKALPPVDCSVSSATPPICLVLDLDETLVHCTVEPVTDADMTFPVEFNGAEYLVHVRCRPFLREFLEAVSRKFEVVIFTASQQVYADKLLDKIDPEGKLIRHRMFRDSCLPVEGNFLKDLTILGRDLSKAVLVDNSPHAFGYQVDNGIPIESWFDDPTDKELLKLEMFLRTLHGVEDVRDVVRKTFQTHRLVLDA